MFADDSNFSCPNAAKIKILCLIDGKVVQNKKVV